MYLDLKSVGAPSPHETDPRSAALSAAQANAWELRNFYLATWALGVLRGNVAYYAALAMPRSVLGLTLAPLPNPQG